MKMFELFFIGLIVGTLSGFFGIGGGTILVPLLLFVGYGIKEAVGISIVQMVFSSVYGSYLNNKKGTLDISMVIAIGIGGFAGAFFSGYLSRVLPSFVIEIVFFAFVFFALIRLFFSPKEQKTQKNIAKTPLFFIGFIIGLFSMLIGVGGSIMLVPILVGFLHVELKKATSAGLFFVVFSSVSGLISHLINGQIDFKSGIIIGLASLFGVYVGVHAKGLILNTTQKKILVMFYLIILMMLLKRFFING